MKQNRFMTIAKGIGVVFSAALIFEGIFDTGGDTSLFGQFQMVLMGIVGLCLFVPFQERYIVGFVSSTLTTIVFIGRILFGDMLISVLPLIFPIAAVWFGYKSWPLISRYIGLEDDAPVEPVIAGNNAVSDINHERVISTSSHKTVCPRCGSTNIQFSVHQESKSVTHTTKTKSKYREKRHGFLWWLIFGWWWWIVEIFIWVCFFPFKLIYELIRKRKYVGSSVGKTTTKNRVSYQTVCVCQDCGHNWKA